MTATVNIVRDPDTWRLALHRIGRHDFVHTWDFHEISQKAGEGEPEAFVVGQPDDPLFFWPLLRRTIPDSDRFDYGSVYGYAGPLVRNGADARSAVQLCVSRMAAGGAISLTSRMHPLFVDSLPLDARGRQIGEVVVIDVTATSDQPEQSYRNNHRRDLRKLSAAGITTELVAGSEGIERFLPIYNRTMNELNAADYYFFPVEYYRQIFESIDFESFFIFARQENHDISGVLFATCGDILQYFLSGTEAEFRRQAPSKLIIAHAHRLAAKRGINGLILGGGIGGRRDALFNFKLGFSKDVRPHYLYTAVLDQPAYYQLSAQRGSDPASSYFPSYRA